jgi:hypothetical protein
MTGMVRRAFSDLDLGVEILIRRLRRRAPQGEHTCP